MVAVTLLTVSLSACSQDDQQTVYDRSVDVSLLGWTSTDTLSYPLVVADAPTFRVPIELGQDYGLSISLRYGVELPLTHLPFQLLLQQTDTVGGYLHPVGNLLRQHLALAVNDSLGIPLGDTWGSLISQEVEMPDLTIRFDSAASYRFLIIPEEGLPHTLPGLASIGLRLYAK